jgi:hypothetical protein
MSEHSITSIIELIRTIARYSSLNDNQETKSRIENECIRFINSIADQDSILQKLEKPFNLRSTRDSVMQKTLLMLACMKEMYELASVIYDTGYSNLYFRDETQKSALDILNLRIYIYYGNERTGINPVYTKIYQKLMTYHILGLINSRLSRNEEIKFIDDYVIPICGARDSYDENDREMAQNIFESLSSLRELRGVNLLQLCEPRETDARVVAVRRHVSVTPVTTFTRGNSRQAEQAETRVVPFVTRGTAEENFVTWREREEDRINKRNRTDDRDQTGGSKKRKKTKSKPKKIKNKKQKIKNKTKRKGIF